MQGKARARSAAVLLVSAAAHLVVLGGLAMHRGRLAARYEAPPVIALDIRPVIIPDRSDPQTPLASRPLAPRQGPRAPRDAPLPPLVIAPTSAEPEPARRTAPTLSEILGTRPDCREPHRLSREQREACQERIGGGGLGPQYGIAPPLAARFRRGPELPPEPQALAPPGSDNIGDPYVAGGGASIGGAPTSPSRRATRATPRLPP